MDFALDEMQVELASTVRALLDKRSDSGAVRAAVEMPEGYDADLWRTLAEQIGVAGLAIPEDYDGAGATFFEAALVLEELGAAVTPTPFLATLVAAETLLAAADEDAKARLLPRIAAGETATVALEPGEPVLDGDRAAILLAIVGDDLVEVDRASVSAQWRASMDQTIRLADVDLTGATTTRLGDAAPARARAELVMSAAAASLAVGVSDRALRMTVDYSQQRVQFGRPIGSFQALKHRMADVLVRLELARSATWAAAYSLDEQDVHAAAAVALDLAAHATGECIQLHGGIAITWEHDAHLLFKRAHALAQLAGPSRHHRAAITL